MVKDFNVGFDELGVKVEHHMPAGDGVYMKRVDVKAGCILTGHTHSFTHKSILASGSAIVRAGDRTQLAKGPFVLTVLEGEPHSVEAVTDITWFCIHASTEEDSQAIDHTLVSEG